MPGLVACCNKAPHTGWSVTASSQGSRNLSWNLFTFRSQPRNIKMKLACWLKKFFPCFIPAPSACLISGNSLSWHRGVRVQHAKVIRSPRLSLVILGTSVRLMELWGQEGGGIRDKNILNVSKGKLQGYSKWQVWFSFFLSHTRNLSVNVRALKKMGEHCINCVIL